ncbi:MAG: FtsX-like permease family protein [Chloroflexi bacterium]|nr:FtsX-like permease family protein [Chloroflexota bacterium]
MAVPWQPSRLEARGRNKRDGPVRLFGFLTWLTVRRARAHWRFMLASALGVLLAVALASGAMLHSQTLAEAGLQHALVNDVARDYLHLQVFILDRPLGEKDYRRLDTLVGEGIDRRLAWLFGGMHRYGKTNELPFTLTRDEALPDRDIPLSYLYFLAELQENARLVSGRWPAAQPPLADGTLVLEGVVGRQARESLDWTEGVVLYLVPFEEVPQEKIAVTIVGVVEPLDTRSPYWFGDVSHFRVSFETEEDAGGYVVPVYVGEQQFFQGVGSRYPMLVGDYRWYASLKLDTLTAASASQARQDLKGLESDLNQRLARVFVFSRLIYLVDEYHRNLALARVPLFIFVSLVVGVVLYYLVVATLLQARERGAESAVLRSRGASLWQVGALLGLGEGLATALPAVLLGPPLGLLTARLLPVGEEGLVYPGPGLSLALVVAAVLAGLVCIAVFLAAGLNVASKSIVGFLRGVGRTPLRGSLYRYALDLLALALLGLLWWQVSSRGGLLARPLSGGGVSIDPAILLGPAVALLAAGLALLRFMPLALRLLAWLADWLGPVTLVHGLRRMAREPLAYAHLVVLLMLATALGIFGAIFGATLSRGQADRVRYNIGGEVVVNAAVSPRTPGVEQVMPLYRERLGTPGDPYGVMGYSLLGVIPAALPKVAWFREDFAEEPLNELLTPLRAPLPLEQGIGVPRGAVGLGLWVKAERPLAGYDVRLRLKDSLGRRQTLRLGDLSSDTWTYLEAPLASAGFLAPPLQVTGILFRGGSFVGYGQGWVAIDDLTAKVDEEALVIEEFESPGSWVLLPNLGIAQDSLMHTRLASHTGGKGALFTWTDPVGLSPRGLLIPAAPIPIPAIGSPSFHKGQQLIGQIEGQTVRLVIEGEMTSFPTLYPSESPFVIVSLEHLVRHLSAVGLSRPIRIGEYWVSLEEGSDRLRALENLESYGNAGAIARDREVLAAAEATDPLNGGAWRSIGYQGTVALGFSAILGLGLYGGISVRRSRLELGVLQALGLSRRQTVWLLGLEHLVMAVVGIGTGAALGLWLGRWTGGYMGVTTSGRVLVPSLDLSLDSWLAVVALAEVAAAALVAVALAVALARRLKLHEVLRMEE